MYVNIYKILSLMSVFAVTLSAFILLSMFTYCMILLGDREIPSTLTNGHIIGQATPGKDVVVAFDVIRTKSCEVGYVQTLYDSEGVRHVIPSYPVGGKRQLNVPVKIKLALSIPASMAKGPARYESSRKYVCNWTQLVAPIVAITDDINFTVE